MEAIVSYFDSLNLDINQLLIIGGVLLVGTILLGAFGRFIFGKKSDLGIAVSSTFGILFIYLISVLLSMAGPEVAGIVTPLPFVSISGETMHFQVFQGHYSFICSELLSMIILSFLVNLADRWLPRGKNIFTWIFFRFLTVVLGYVMHLIVVYLFSTLLPQGIVTYAPTVLLAILILLLLTGALKLIVGALLSVSMGPVIGALYTFFFANIVGKQITRAVLTTAILTGLVYLLNHLGIYAISIASAALIAYIPFLLLLVVVWYFVNKLI